LSGCASDAAAVGRLSMLEKGFQEDHARGKPSGGFSSRPALAASVKPKR
jgi:hypothetical protein